MKNPKIASKQGQEKQRRQWRVKNTSISHQGSTSQVRDVSSSTHPTHLEYRSDAQKSIDFSSERSLHSRSVSRSQKRVFSRGKTTETAEMQEESVSKTPNNAALEPVFTSKHLTNEDTASDIFNQLPIELKLEVVFKLDKDTQISLARAGHLGNQLANDKGTELSCFKKRELEAAIVSKKPRRILKMFSRGVCPDNLSDKIEVNWNGYEECVERSAPEAKLDCIGMAINAYEFKVADKLLKRGAMLSPLSDEISPRNLGSIMLESDFPKVTDLYIALRTQKSNVLHMQDVEGNTLLHHAVRMPYEKYPLKCKKVIHLLFGEEHLNFNIKNKGKNTALHEIVRRCDQKVIYKYVFPHFLEAAIKRNFDFSSRDRNGFTILHLAATVHCEENWPLKDNLIKIILENVSDYPIDMISSNGRSALHIAISSLRFDNVQVLLDKGANPMVGKRGKLPLTLLEKQIKSLKRYDDEKRKQLVKIKSRIEEIIKTKTKQSK